MHSAADKLDCFVRVITPENIEFEYALAGPFQRLPAFLFDLVVRGVVLVGLLVVLGIVLSWAPLGTAFLAILTSLLFFFMSWFYGIFFETRFNGRTLGKMVFKLRVISVDGRPINAVQAALRNLLRLADMGVLVSLQIFDSEAPPAFVIPTMIIGLVAMTFTPRMQRIGDLAAGTMVVSEQRRRSPWNLQPEDLRAFGLAELIPVNYQVSSSMAQTIGLYMENRKRLSPLRRNEVAKHLSLPLIREFELLPDTSPDLLLCALYVRIYLSEQQREQGRARMRQVMTPPPPPVQASYVSPTAAPALKEIAQETTTEKMTGETAAALPTGSQVVELPADTDRSEELN